MLKVGLGILVSVLILVGCDSNDEKLTELQSYKWLGESCLQAQDKNGTLQDIWYKNLVSFTIDDQVLMSSDVYSDANCTKKFSGAEESNPVVVYSSFYDNGEVEFVNDYKIHDIVIEANLKDTKEIVEGKYAINEEGRLCFSQMLYFSECDGSIPASPDFKCSEDHFLGYVTYLDRDISYDSCFMKNLL